MMNLTPKMLLKKLIDKRLNPDFSKVVISGISSDSKKIKKNFVFFALKGRKFDGKKFVGEAILKGAKVIIHSGNIIKKKNIYYIKVKNVKRLLNIAVNNFYNKQPKNIIAITGTNGKTSVADFYRQLMLLSKKKVATIGTLGVLYKKKIFNSKLTSPDLISTHDYLHKLKKKGVENVAIETSSHGLSQGRVDAIKFKTGIFTNFSQDHLDYHKTMANYFNAKMVLFKKYLSKKNSVILNNEEKVYKKIKKLCDKKKIKIILTNNKKIKIIFIKNLDNGQHIKFKHKSKYFDVKVPLIGKIQITNLIFSMIAANLSGIKMQKIIKNCNKIKQIEGRLKFIRKLKNNSKILVDFAHTPNALETVLKDLISHYNTKNISIVFGCGGDRDKTKRFLMGRIASKYCKKIYITDDNPRNENPKKIRIDIIKGINKKKDIFEISKRSDAIKFAIKNSSYKEIILVAGKGHENYQIYKNKKNIFSDSEIIKKTKFQKINLKLFNQNQNSKLLRELIKSKKKINFNQISINSKKISENNIFVGVKGKNYDGSNFAKDAISNGSKLVVVSKKLKNIQKGKVVIIKNTLGFLNKFAQKKRDRVSSKIIGITGSSGKTTLKNSLAEMLSLSGKTFYSPKSYNNKFGVPLSLSNLQFTDDYGVFEIGMSKKGEIKNLSKILKPDIGIITNIGNAHIENFNNQAQIASAKGELIQNIKEGGTIILNKDDKYFTYLKNLAKKNKKKVLSFGLYKNSDFYVFSRKNYLNVEYITFKLIDNFLQIKTKPLNDIQIKNLLCIFAVFNILGKEYDIIKNNIDKIKLLEGRGKIFKVKKYNKRFYLIDESYNSNPSANNTAIQGFSKLNIGKYNKYLILGDMLELGSKSKNFHKNLSTQINKSKINKLFVYGNDVLTTFKHVDKIKRGTIFQNFKDIDEILPHFINNNDYIMVKGSNATQIHNFSKNLLKGKINAL